MKERDGGRKRCREGKEKVIKRVGEREGSERERKGRQGGRMTRRGGKEERG